MPLHRTVTCINAEIIPGATLEEAAHSVCDLAANMSCYVKFTFEGIDMQVSFHHTPDEIIKEWKQRKEAVGYMEREPINRVI